MKLFRDLAIRGTRYIEVLGLGVVDHNGGGALLRFELELVAQGDSHTRWVD